jgi:hypothetical protein
MRKDKIFQIIGKLTIQFATIEHRLQGLLEILMGDSNTLVGPLFIHNMSLAALLRKISIVSRCKLTENPQLHKELEVALKKINSFREERNLLIHGDWNIENNNTSLNIKVRDFKISCENGTWHDFTETSFTEKKLQSLNRRLNGLSQEIDFLIRRINETNTLTDVTN